MPAANFVCKSKQAAASVRIGVVQSKVRLDAKAMVIGWGLSVNEVHHVVQNNHGIRRVGSKFRDRNDSTSRVDPFCDFRAQQHRAFHFPSLQVLDLQSTSGRWRSAAAFRGVLMPGRDCCSLKPSKSFVSQGVLE